MPKINNPLDFSFSDKATPGPRIFREGDSILHNVGKNTHNTNLDAPDSGSFGPKIFNKNINPFVDNNDESVDDYNEIIVYVVFGSNYNQFIEYNNKVIRDLSREYTVHVLSVDTSVDIGIDVSKILPDYLPENVNLKRIKLDLSSNILSDSNFTYFKEFFLEIKNNGVNNVEKFILYDYSSREFYDSKKVINLAKEIFDPNSVQFFHEPARDLYVLNKISELLNTSIYTKNDIKKNRMKNFNIKFKEFINCSPQFKIWFEINYLSGRIKYSDIYSSYNNQYILSEDNKITKNTDQLLARLFGATQYDKDFLRQITKEYRSTIELYSVNYLMKMKDSL